MSTTAITVAFAPWTIVRPVVIRLVGGFVSAFEGNARLDRFQLSITAHFGALLFENRLARQFDAIAFNGQHLHQDLVAFLQLVAYIVDAMLRDFADVQQAIGAWQNLDERSELGEARYLAEVGLPYFGGGGDVVDHLQSLPCRSLSALPSYFSTPAPLQALSLLDRPVTHPSKLR